MAHDINAYVGRLSAWHNLGTVIGDYMSIDDLLANTELNYQVKKFQLEFQGKPIDSFGTFRLDSMEFLANVGEGYEVMQHTDGFKILDSLVGNGITRFETAGALGRGERVWGLAKLDTDMLIGGEDKIENYLLFSTSHDGSLAFEFRLTTIRVVCANTLRAAKSQGMSSFKVYHTKNALVNMENALQAMSATRHEIKTIEEKLNFLNNRIMTQEAMDDIFKVLFKADEKKSQRGATRLENTLDEILNLYENNDRNTFTSQRGTAYNLLNAIVEYADFGKPNNLTYGTIGAGAKLKEAAFDLIYDNAGNLREKERIVYSIPAPDTSNEDVVADLLGLN
jgi:phage/plasmid-like protein (TIGR03299 family)